MKANYKDHIIYFLVYASPDNLNSQLVIASINRGHPASSRSAVIERSISGGRAARCMHAARLPPLAECPCADLNQARNTDPVTDHPLCH
jgi:hypothetical protein